MNTNGSPGFTSVPKINQGVPHTKSKSTMVSMPVCSGSRFEVASFLGRFKRLGATGFRHQGAAIGGVGRSGIVWEFEINPCPVFLGLNETHLRLCQTLVDPDSKQRKQQMAIAGHCIGKPSTSHTIGSSVCNLEQPIIRAPNFSHPNKIPTLWDKVSKNFGLMQLEAGLTTAHPKNETHIFLLATRKHSSDHSNRKWLSITTKKKIDRFPICLAHAYLLFTIDWVGGSPDGDMPHVCQAYKEWLRTPNHVNQKLSYEFMLENSLTLYHQRATEIGDSPSLKLQYKATALMNRISGNKSQETKTPLIDQQKQQNGPAFSEAEMNEFTHQIDNVCTLCPPDSVCIHTDLDDLDGPSQWQQHESHRRRNKKDIILIFFGDLAKCIWSSTTQWLTQCQYDLSNSEACWYFCAQDRRGYRPTNTGTESETEEDFLNRHRRHSEKKYHKISQNPFSED